MAHVMNSIVATARNARLGIRLDRGQRSRIGIVSGAFLKGTRPKMAMQTLAIVERLVELDILRQRRFSHVIDVQVPQTTELRFDRAEHGVVRVARIAGFVRGYPVILEVCSGKIGRIVYVQALAVRLHNVAGKAEGSAFRALHFIFHASHQRKQWKKEKYPERKNLPGAACGDRGTHHKNARERPGE